MLKLRKHLFAPVFEFDSVWQKSQPLEDLANIKITFFFSHVY